MKGFEAGYEDEQEENIRPPRPGTIAYLRLMEQEKRERTRKSRLEHPTLETESGSLSGSDTVCGSGPLPVSGPVGVSGSLSGSDTVTEPDTLRVSNHVDVLRNFTKFHNSLFRILPLMTEGEIRLYLYLVEKSYGAVPARNFAEYSQREAMKDTKIKSPSTMSKSMTALCEKGLVAWYQKSHTKGIKSHVRVFLPCELSETDKEDILLTD